MILAFVAGALVFFAGVITGATLIQSQYDKILDRNNEI